MTNRSIKAKHDHNPTTDIKSAAKELGLSNDDLVIMLRTMVIIRHFENMADHLYAMGKVHGTMHLSAGQEAVAVGMGKVMLPEDYLLNHHRGHGHFIASGADINRMMAEFLGKNTGFCRGRGGSMHIADVESNNLGANGIVGGSMELVVGVGLAIKMKKEKRVAFALFGDGAVNEGIFHESMNMAAIWKLPIIYLCENNHYGMSAHITDVSSKVPFKHRSEAHGIPGYFIDGNDVLAVHKIMKNAVDHARSGKGPVFVEAETYRYYGHSKSDRNLYRTKDEIEAWKERDPITRFADLLKDANLITEESIEEINREAQQIIEKAVEFADNSPDPDVKNVMEGVYA